jgi:outer membrane protein OmpA-like peptidoglycan-associated protein
MSIGSNSRGCRLLKAAPLAIFAVVLCASAGAQSDNTPKWDVFGGYQWQHPGGTVPLSTGDPDSPTAYKLPDESKGIGGAFTYNFDAHFGLETDFGYSRDTPSSSSEWTVSIGPRLIWRTDAAAMFLHALGGFNRVNYDEGNGIGLTGNNGIGAILGGGLDIPITKQFGWRVFEANYVWTRHNYAGIASEVVPDLRRPNFEGARLSTGVVYAWGGAPALVPAASCSIQPAEVLVGEPLTATVSATNFNPKHTVSYSWSGTGGNVSGKDTTASIDTNGAAPGSYTVTAKVTDAKETKNNMATCSANFTIKPLPPKNPPTMTLSASPTDLVTGGTVNLTASCTSPDNVSVSVANWTATGGTVSGSGTSATLSTSGVPAGSVNVTATCTDARGLTGQASTQVTVENPPPPPVDKALEARLALHSVYFPTDLPPIKNPQEGLLVGQQKILIALATDFKKYLEAKPDAHLILQGHADIRGPAAYNQALSERRVARVKSFLVEQGVPEGDIETEAFGAQHNLTLDEVKDSINNNPELTSEERQRALLRINVIKLASNRRVDVTLKAGATTENSVKQFPFNSADALSLIGGRESEMKKPAKPAPKRAPKKQQ